MTEHICTALCTNPANKCPVVGKKLLPWTIEKQRMLQEINGLKKRVKELEDKLDEKDS